MANTSGWEAYLPIAEQAEAEAGLPSGLLRAVMVDGEHWGRAPNPGGVSPKGAKGLLQFMPETAKRFGVDVNDPTSSIRGAAKYLKVLYDEFQDPILAAAAYNAGEGAVRRYKGIPPYKETLGYTDRIRRSSFLQTAAPQAPEQELAGRQAIQPNLPPASLGAPRGIVEPDMGVYSIPGTNQPQGGINYYGDPRRGAKSGYDPFAPYDPNMRVFAPYSIQTAPEVPQVQENSWWDDVKDAGRNTVIGLLGIGRAGTYAALQAYDSKFTRELDNTAAQWQQNWMASLTAQAQAADQKEWVDSDPGEIVGEAWTDWRSYSNTFFRSLPSLLVGLGIGKAAAVYGQAAGAAAGRAAAMNGANAAAVNEISRKVALKAATRVGGIGGAIAEGSIGGGQTGSEAHDEIMRMDENTLRTSEIYQNLLAGGLTPQDARYHLARNGGLKAMIVAGVADGIFAGVGDAMLARYFVGKNAGRIRTAAGVALREAAQEAPQSGAEQLGQNLGVQLADPSRPTWQGVPNAAVGGAIGGLMGGGAFGAIAGPGTPTDLLPNLPQGNNAPPPLLALPGPPNYPQLPPAAPGVPTYQFGETEEQRAARLGGGGIDPRQLVGQPIISHPGMAIRTPQDLLALPDFTTPPLNQVQPEPPGLPYSGDYRVRELRQLMRAAQVPGRGTRTSDPAFDQMEAEQAARRQAEEDAAYSQYEGDLEQQALESDLEYDYDLRAAEVTPLPAEEDIPTQAPAPANTALDTPELRALRQRMSDRELAAYLAQDVDPTLFEGAEQAAQEQRDREIEAAYRQREEQFMEGLPEEGDAGPTYTPRELTSALASIAQGMPPAQSPVTKSGAPKTQWAWLRNILNSPNPVAAIAAAHQNEQTNPQRAELLEAWYQSLTGTPVPSVAAPTAPATVEKKPPRFRPSGRRATGAAPKTSGQSQQQRSIPAGTPTAPSAGQKSPSSSPAPTQSTSKSSPAPTETSTSSREKLKARRAKTSAPKPAEQSTAPSKSQNSDGTSTAKSPASGTKNTSEGKPKTAPATGTGSTEKAKPTEDLARTLKEKAQAKRADEVRDTKDHRVASKLSELAEDIKDRKVRSEILDLLGSGMTNADDTVIVENAVPAEQWGVIFRGSVEGLVTDYDANYLPETLEWLAKYGVIPEIYAKDARKAAEFKGFKDADDVPPELDTEYDEDVENLSRSFLPSSYDEMSADDLAAMVATRDPMTTAAREAIQRGDTRALLEHFARDGQNAFIRQFAQRLLDMGILPKVRFVGPKTFGKIGQLGRYSPNSHTVELLEMAPESVVLHELAHAATSRAYNIFVGEATGSLTLQQRQAVAELLQLYRIAKIRGGRKFKGAFLNPKEFIAEVFGENVEFQEWLHSQRTDKRNWLQRFWDAVRRLFGLKTPQGADTLLTDAVKVGYRLFGEVQDYRGRAASDAFTLAGRKGRKVADDIGGLTVALSDVSRAKRMLGRVKAMTPTLLKAMTLRQITDVYGGALNGLKDYASRIHAMDSKVTQLTQAADDLVNRWRTLSRDMSDKLGEVFLLGTTWEMHPDKSLADQSYLMHDEAGKPLQGAALQQVHQNYNALTQKWAALDPAAKKLYGEVQKMLEAHWQEVKRLALDNIENSKLPDAKKATMKKRINAELKKTRGPYFPLKRFGKYVVVAKQGDNREVPTFDSWAEAEQAAEDYRKAGWEAKAKPSREFSESDAVPGSFLQGMTKAIEDALDPDEAAILLDAMHELYIKNLPEMSGAKAFLRRRNIPGWSKDARRAFASSMFHGAFYQAKLENLQPLRDQLMRMQKDADAKGGEASMVFDHMKLLHGNAMKRWDMPLVDTLGNVNYVWYLGFTPSFAVLNLLQNPFVTLPMIGARFGFVATQVEMMRTAKQVAGARFKQSFKNGWSSELDLSSVTSDKGEREMLTQLMNEGLIDLTQARDLGTVAGGRNERLQALMRAATFLPHHTEVFNRVTAALVAYRRAKKNSKSGVDPTAYAREVVANSHFDYSNNNKPYFMTPGFSRLSKLIFALKQYQQHMIYSLVRNFHQSFKGATPEERKVARRTLYGLFVMHGLAAGAMGLPFAAIPFAAANMLKEAFGDDDEPFDSEVAFRNFLADAVGLTWGEMIARGPLGRGLGANISSRTSLSDLGLLWRWTDGSEGRSAWNEMVAGIMGPAFAIPGGVFEGVKHWSNGNYMRGWESMSPKFMRDLVRGARYAKDGEVTARGQTVIAKENMDNMDIVMQIMGFQSSRMAEIQEGRRAAIGTDIQLNERRSQLIRDMVDARSRKDEDATKAAREAIRAFNRKHPEQGITATTIIRSMKARRKDDILTDERGITRDPKERAATQAARFVGAS